LKRAFRKLNTIRGAAMWWTRSDEPVALLRSGKAALSTAPNGEVSNGLMRGDHLGVIWDRQLYEFDVFGIPKGDPRRARAAVLFRYATGTVPLARAAEWVPFGPARLSSLPVVGRNPELGIDMQAHLPTAQANYATAFAVDDAWWLTHRAQIEPLWRKWMKGTIPD
jgi:putative spermidine/putrescine transport system substrate-binding protein